MSIPTGRILVVDDEPQIHRFLNPALTASGYESVRAERGDEALRLAASRAPDAILLDLGLPDMDGHEVLAKLREFTDVPVIILSARDRETEKIAALDAGADDYIEKPFGLGELLARIRTALRHRLKQDNAEKPLTVGGLTIDPILHRVTLDEEVLPLTRREHALLLLLARNRGRVLTHRQILTAIWGHAHTEDVAYLRVYIGQLRRKLGEAFAALIITEPGIGYRLQDGEN
ncbi:MAG TPA: response regulator transcription factor [Acidocella sp.]|jgi:two-component system KDP operon response regulator KdpE|uniref:response regulator transcription factor n=1 Tax=Acidocella sp. TaxID=50710 RepID=UPI002BE59D0F|nr:response regulator transcription factor [Acidocella sp.]HVE21519.1 response regulator transcription factor [Acidocella sp.]